MRPELNRWKGVLILAMLLLGCDPKPSKLAPDVPPEQHEVEADYGRDARLPDENVADATTRSGCLDAYGAQIVQLFAEQGQVDSVGDRFRFGRETDGLMYETEWVGDLNEDGADDLVARRDAKGDRQVRMVLIRCEKGFALAWAGVAAAVAASNEVQTDDEGIRWRHLRITDVGGARTFRFHRGKYQPAR